MRQAVFVILAFLISVEALAEDRFVRVRRDANQTVIGLDVAIEHYELPDAKHDGSHTAKVDLVSAVHVADRTFFKTLNSRFADYQAVLFELIAPPHTDFSKIQARQSDHPVSLAQRALTSALGLSFQLEEINYGAKNFVHADLNSDQFDDTMQKRNESFEKLFWTVVLNDQAAFGDNAPKAPQLSSIFLLLSQHSRALGLKRLLAPQFTELEGLSTLLNKSGGSTLVSARNEVVLRRLQELLSQGKTSVAIFYGAAHMPDLSRSLASSGFKLVATEWLTAWDLSTR